MKVKMADLQLASSQSMVQWLAQGIGDMGARRALLPACCPNLS